MQIKKIVVSLHCQTNTYITMKKIFKKIFWRKRKQKQMYNLLLEINERFGKVVTGEDFLWVADRYLKLYKISNKCHFATCDKLFNMFMNISNTSWEESKIRAMRYDMNAFVETVLQTMADIPYDLSLRKHIYEKYLKNKDVLYNSGFAEGTKMVDTLTSSQIVRLTVLLNGSDIVKKGGEYEYN